MYIHRHTCSHIHIHTHTGTHTHTLVYIHTSIHTQAHTLSFINICARTLELKKLHFLVSMQESNIFLWQFSVFLTHINFAEKILEKKLYGPARWQEQGRLKQEDVVPGQPGLHGESASESLAMATPGCQSLQPSGSARRTRHQDDPWICRAV